MHVQFSLNSIDVRRSDGSCKLLVLPIIVVLDNLLSGSI